MLKTVNTCRDAKYVDSDELVDRPSFWTTFIDGTELIISLLRRLNIVLNHQITFSRCHMISNVLVLIINKSLRRDRALFRWAAPTVIGGATLT